MRACMHACMHMFARGVHARTRRPSSLQSEPYRPTVLSSTRRSSHHACMRILVHAFMHAFMHTHMHMHKNTCAGVPSSTRRSLVSSWRPPTPSDNSRSPSRRPHAHLSSRTSRDLRHSCPRRSRPRHSRPRHSRQHRRALRQRALRARSRGVPCHHVRRLATHPRSGA